MNSNLANSQSTPQFSDSTAVGPVSTWALPDGAIARLGRGAIGAFTLSPDGKFLTVGTAIGVWWYDLATMIPLALWETERGMISALAFSNDGQRLAIGNGDGSIKVWDVQQRICTLQMERQTERRPVVTHLAFSPNAQYLAASGVSNPIVDIWCSATGELRLKLHGDAQMEGFPYLRYPITFSPDNCLLACASPAAVSGDCNAISVWDIETGQCVICLTEHTDFFTTVRSLCFSPSGDSFVAGGKGTIQVWDVNNWSPQKRYSDYGESNMYVTYTEAGVLHATSFSEETVVVWDVARGEKRHIYFEQRARQPIVHFSKDAHFIVAGTKEWTMWTDDIAPPRKSNHLHFDFPNSIVFTPNGKTIGTASRCGDVLCWEMNHPAYPLTRFKLPGKNHHVSVSDCGHIYATGLDSNIAKVWLVGEREPSHTFTLPEVETEATSAAFSQTALLLACGGITGAIYVWDVQTEKLFGTLMHELLDKDWRRYNDWFQYIVFSPDGKWLVSSTDRGPVSRMWNIQSGEELTIFPKKTRGITFSPCSNIVACGRREEILLWDVKRCETLCTLPQLPRDFSPDALVFSPCGRYLASGYSWRRGAKKVPIHLWDVRNGKNITTFCGHPSDIQCLAFSPNGEILVSGGYDGTILLWDLKPYL
ncbi:WD40 repeat domain-containing protein [Candidatus Poribacteria bacterium]|nr:WD40 repeat domain-containing protein [Candidatus Poribacteria bacterium]MYG05978.1 WD40 repeat domain-containing protein [Candidatus Poribacteria bacterium]MYK23882.1 WD40 repeat domain-containing protein [Candidatus Poribacteria bacterium]